MVRSLTVIRCVVHTFKTAPSVNRPTAHLAVIAIASFRYPMECEANILWMNCRHDRLLGFRFQPGASAASAKAGSVMMGRVRT
jgi:hypothetical protein